MRVIFGRLDAWTSWADYKPDSLPRSILLILHSIIDLFKPATFRKRQRAFSLKPKVTQPTLHKTAVIVRPKTGLVRLITVTILASSVLGGGHAWAQQSPDDLPLPHGSVETHRSSAPAQGGAAASSSQTGPSIHRDVTPDMTGSAGPAAPVPVAPAVPAAVGSSTFSSNAPALAEPSGAGREELENARTTSWSFTQLGSAATLIMTPWIPIQGLNFGVPPSEVVTAATLTLNGSLSPDMLPAGSGVTIFLNDQFIGVIHPDKLKPQFETMSFTINPLFFKEHNILTFHFAGQYTLSCGDQTSSLLWAKILGQSSISITSAPLPSARDLAALPAPFFNDAVLTPARIPFVMPSHSLPRTLEASAVLASWFGSLADYRGANFPVMAQLPPSRSAVVVGPANTLGPFLSGQAQVTGPTVIETVNTNDAFGTILIVTGRSDDEVVAAARSIAFGSKGFPHDQRIAAPQVSIDPRKPFDAPGFVTRTQPIRIGDLVALSSLQGYGYVPGTISVPFRTTPDIYTWRNHPLSMHFTVRGPLGTEIDRKRSHVDVSVNGIYLKSVSLAPPSDLPDWLRACLEI